MEDKRILNSTKQITRTWNRKHWFQKSKFFIFQSLSAIFTSLTGLFTHVGLDMYPAVSSLSPISRLGVGFVLSGSIGAANTSATLITTINKTKRMKWIRIITMILSLSVGFLGFWGISTITKIGCCDLSNPFCQCTKYGVHTAER
jgi:hypothetical protein